MSYFWIFTIAHNIISYSYKYVMILRVLGYHKQLVLKYGQPTRQKWHNLITQV